MAFRHEIHAEPTWQHGHIDLTEVAQRDAPEILVHRVSPHGVPWHPIPIQFDRRGAATTVHDIFWLAEEPAARHVNAGNRGQEIREGKRTRPDYRAACEAVTSPGRQRSGGGFGLYHGKRPTLGHVGQLILSWRVDSCCGGVLQRRGANGRRRGCQEGRRDSERPERFVHPAARLRMNCVRRRTPTPVGPRRIAGRFWSV